MRATSLIVNANSLLSERGSIAIPQGPAAIWLLKKRQHNIRNLMILSSHFGRVSHAGKKATGSSQANPRSAKAALWWAAAAGAKQQNTTRAMPRGDPANSAATVPTAMRAAWSGGKR